jgi:hypothetical protein
MNSHTWSSLIGFITLGIGDIALFLGYFFERTRKTLAVVLAAVGLTGIAAALASFVFLGGEAWYSPSAAQSVSSAIVQELNQVGRPSTSAEAAATIQAGIYTVEGSSPVTVTAVAAETFHFTIKLSGDSAKTCVVYVARTKLWAWSSGVCR